MINRLRVLSSIEEIPKEDWNALAVQTAPTLDWEYLHALEKSGSVSDSRGYKPSHLVLYNGSVPIGAVPLYERDRAWVEFGDGGLIEFLTELTGLPFHSGLVGSIPFTPVPGYDFLHSPDSDPVSVYRYLLSRIDDLCMARGLSTSRIYFVAPGSHLHPILAESGYVGLTSSHLSWVNRGFGDFDDYLATFKSSRRTKIKREWRSIHEQGVSMEMIRGIDAPPAIFEDMHLLYKRTWMKHMGPGIRPFLNESFFKLLMENYGHRSSFVVASLNGRRVAMSLFYHKNQILYGRYWGSFREVPFLHFAACYYFPIAYSIKNRFREMDPGFGGAHKYIRGFEEVPVSHYIKFFDEKQRRIAFSVIEQMQEQLILK